MTFLVIIHFVAGTLPMFSQKTFSTSESLDLCPMSWNLQAIPSFKKNYNDAFSSEPDLVFEDGSVGFV
jgi:hypothetical protein